MSNKDNKNIEKHYIDESDDNILETGEKFREFSIEKPSTVSSTESIEDNWIISDDMDEILELEEEVKEVKVNEEVEEKETAEEEQSPIFKKLADPKLPELPKENRARLQMQSPTKLYFYWSVKTNPFQTLNKVFSGRTGNYTLVVKLKNKTSKTEEIYSVEPEGNWWFNVDSDAEYVAEIGFYAPSRPFIRVIFSNDILTPRKTPSKRRDYTPSFNVSASEFAEVLDVAGYQRDAFEVAFAGDDEAIADKATNKTYTQLVGKNTEEFAIGNDGDEIRFVLLALASGYSIEDIKDEINQSLYNSIKDEIETISAEKVLSALKENFDILTDEIIDEESISNAVFGASLVNFPKRIKKRTIPKTLSPKLTDKDMERLKKLSPLSSANFK